ncbi:MAG: glycerol-3-phosphate 1-O-acyltransferase PlsY, partial [Gemmatimonadota bacterium]
MTWGLLAAGYLVGSIPTSFLLARMLGIDLRLYGSGNLGATNLYRAAGLWPALVAGVVDVAKGAAPTYAFPMWANAGPAWAAAFGCAAIAGHVWPVWLRLRGGKGVATAGGMFLVLAPVATLIAFTLWLVVVSATRIASLGSLLAALSLPILTWASGRPSEVIAVATAAAAFVCWTHRANLGRLWRGEELPAERGAEAPQK